MIPYVKSEVTKVVDMWWNLQIRNEYAKYYLCYSKGTETKHGKLGLAEGRSVLYSDRYLALVPGNPFQPLKFSIGWTREVAWQKVYDVAVQTPFLKTGA